MNILLRKGTLACQPSSVATVPSEAYIQVLYHWYSKPIEK